MKQGGEMLKKRKRGGGCRAGVRKMHLFGEGKGKRRGWGLDSGGSRRRERRRRGKRGRVEAVEQWKGDAAVSRRREG